MKKHILIASLVGMAAVSSFGQGQVAIKTSLSKNPVYYSLDNATATLVDSTGTVPGASGGTIQFEALYAPSGTPALTAAQLAPSGFVVPAGWTALAVGPVTWSTASPATGVVTPAVNITLPQQGGSVEMEIIAFTGTFANPTYWGFSGDSGSFTANSAAITTTGVTGWAQGVSNPSTTPPGTPVAVVAGTAGLGSIVLAPVPEPSTIALGGLGAAALLFFRRRK